MSTYAPKYTTRFEKDEIIIHVSISGRHFKFAKLTEKEKLHFFLTEAAKSPLKAMACIHKYARKKDPLALQIASIYAAYQAFLETRTPLPKIPKNLQLLLHTLLPGFAETLPSIEFMQEPKLVPSQARYNAFPDLIKYEGTYYLAFREGSKHQGDRGKVRILKSKHADDWEPEALLESPTYDLRDPKFFVDDHKRLHLIIGTNKMVPHVAHLQNNQWTLEEAKVDHQDKLWIWQVSWQGHAGYGFAYGPNDYRTLHLMKTTDSRSFEKIAEISSKPYLTETTIRFKPDGTAIALIRADPKTLIGHASPPYTSWTTHSLTNHGGGHNFIPYGKAFLATTRHLFLTPKNRVHERQLIALLDEKSLIPIQTIKSQIDTGYAAPILEEDGSLTLAYYSAQSPQTSYIYIVKIKLINI